MKKGRDIQEGEKGVGTLEIIHAASPGASQSHVRRGRLPLAAPRGEETPTLPGWGRLPGGVPPCPRSPGGPPFPPTYLSSAESGCERRRMKPSKAAPYARLPRPALAFKADVSAPPRGGGDASPGGRKREKKEKKKVGKKKRNSRGRTGRGLKGAKRQFGVALEQRPASLVCVCVKALLRNKSLTPE